MRPRWHDGPPPHRGIVDIYLDGVKLKSLDLYAEQVSANWLLFSRNLPSVGSHVLMLVAQSAPGRKRVDIDAYEVRSTLP